MKKMKGKILSAAVALILVITTVFNAFPISAEAANVIDMSHDGTSGNNFGSSTDEIKRFETFTVDSNYTLDSVDVKIKKNSEGSQSDVTVDLYATSNNLPTGSALASAKIPAGSIGTSYSVQNTKLNCAGLKSGVKYAIVLGQVTPSSDCYSWNNSGTDVFPDEQFGKYNGSDWVDESHNVVYPVGDGWLKVYLSDVQAAITKTIDMSHNGTSGNNFGSSTDEIKRFETFTVDSNYTLDSVDVKIKKNNEGSQSDVTVDLYATSDNLPTGSALASAKIPADSVGTSYSVLNTKLYCAGLKSGEKYAIVLGQVTPSSDCYSWNNSGTDVFPDEQFGKYNGNNWVDESHNVVYPVGDGWLKVNVSSAGEPDDSAKVAADKSALTWNTIKNINVLQNSVTSSLNLPSTGSVYGSIINWTSTDADTVSTAGQVTRSNTDKKVTLIATIKNGTANETESFDLTVLKLSTTNIGVIDQSHSGTTGNNFGSNKDEVKRYETFTADWNATLNSVGLKIQKSSEGKQSNVSVELYATSNNKPTGSALALATIPVADISTSYSIVNVQLNYNGLTNGTKYAIVLSQASNSTDNYSWCSNCNGATDMLPNQQFGKYNGSSWVDESFVGDGWMKLYVSGSGGHPLTDAEKISADKASLTWDTIKNANTLQNAVTKDLNLLTNGVYGSTISWTSTATSTVNAAGKVNRPISVDEAVKLTADIKSGQTSDTVVFDLTVKSEPAPNAALRRPVSNTNPMFVFNTCIGYQLGDTVLGLWNAIPEDIKQNSVLSIAPNDGYGDGKTITEEQQYELLDEWLNTCQSNNIKCIYQISWGPNNLVSLSHIEELYRKYSCFIGVAFTEQTYSLDQGTRCQSIINHLDLANRYGAYVMFDNNAVSGSLGDLGWFNLDSLFNASKTYKNNLIVSQKQTQENGFYAGESMNAGIWLSGHAGNLGVHTDTWSWWETGRGPLFAVRQGARSYEQFKSNLSYPEAQVATELINGITDGATVYTCFENPVYTTQCYGNLTPLFKNVTYPLLKKIVDGTIKIFSKEDVAKRSKLAYIPDGSTSAREDLFTGLYSMDGNISSNANWNKSTGRYGLIPILPSKSSDYEKTLFPVTIKESQFNSIFPNQEDKVKYYNDNFESQYTGNLYVQRIDNTLYTYNPLLDTDENRNASIPLKYNTASELDLTYPTNTYGIITESKDKLDLHIGNYVTDKSELWQNPDLVTHPSGVVPGQAYEKSMNDYIKNSYIPNPQDSKKRNTVITIKGHSGASKPVITLKDVGDHDPSTYTESWVNGVYTLTVSHNGPVDIAIECSGNPYLPTDADLSGLTVEGTAISPDFDSSISNYSASVANSMNNVTVHAEPDNNSATVKINGIAAKSKSVGLNVGSNIITVEVTAQDGITKKQYTLNVQRAGDKFDRMITSIKELDSSILTQDVSYGTEKTSLNLPSTLTATINNKSETISGITWPSNPAYEPTTAGTYTFTAKLPGGYVLASGVDAPVITVVVAEKASDNSHNNSGKTSSESSRSNETSSSSMTTATNEKGGTVAAVTTKPDAAPVVTGNRSAVSVTVPVDVTSVIASATKEKPAEVKIAVPTEEILKQLDNSAVQAVNLSIKVPSAVANNTNAYAQVAINADSSVLQAAKDTQKDITLSVTNGDTGKEIYSWTFSGKGLQNSVASVTNVNLALNVGLVRNDAAASTVIKKNTTDQKASGVLLKFNHSGLLPAEAKVKVYVGDQGGCTPNSKVFLYYLNQTTNALEQMSQSEYTVDADGYVTITISHCSDYVLLPKAATNPYPVQSDTSFPVGVKNGKTYTFAMTVSSKEVPSFTVGNSKAFASTVKHVGNKYYVAVKAAGTAGTMTAVYSTMLKQKPVVMAYIMVIK